MSKKQLTLQRAIDGFLLAKQAEGKSKKTVDWYAYNLRQFTTWLARVPQASSISSIAAEHIREFLNYLREAHVLFEGHRLKRNEKKCGVSQRSVRGAFATLSAFFNWALHERLVALSPTANMHRPKVRKPLRLFSPGKRCNHFSKPAMKATTKQSQHETRRCSWYCWIQVFGFQNCSTSARIA